MIKMLQVPIKIINMLTFNFVKKKHKKHVEIIEEMIYNIIKKGE